VHPTDLDCLSVIALEGEATAGRLVELTGLTSGAVTGVVDRLERAGYVQRVPDTDDRRRVVLRPVPDALGPLAAAFAPMLESSAAMLDRYDDAQLATLTDYVTRCVPMMREETLRLRDAEEQPDAAPDAVEFAGTGARDATLRVTRGAARLTVLARPQAQLFDASFTGSRPTTRHEATASGDVVTVQYRRSPFGMFRTRGQVTLDASRCWRIEIHGGLAHCALDLAAAHVSAVTIDGGVSSVELALPAPTGALPVEVRGGAHAVTITRPAGCGARVAIRGGAANLVLDDERYGAIGGRVDLHAPSGRDGDDRVEVTIRGGANSLSILSAPPRRGG
jgi:DNA-binding MarR family transcriptional regulator